MKMKPVSFVIVVLFYVGIDATSPISNCIGKTSAKYKFDNLPGTGWDNLLNENRGKIIDYQYSECRTTDNGEYLIPDNVFVIPIKSSNIDIFSEIFDHWSNYTSTTSKSINVGGSVGIPGIFSIHGGYSDEYQQVKSEQVGDNSLTIRVGARYENYVSKLQSEVSLDGTFRDRVSAIADHLLSGRKHSARYESQLLIRDFGTHMVTDVTAGAAIYKIEQLNRTSVQTSDLSRSDISRSAGLSFFGSGIDYNQASSTTDNKMTSYLGVRTHSSVRTHGGPMFKPLNFSINEWVENIGNDLVAIDRSGDPLNFVINTNNFQDLTESMAQQTASVVEEAIVTYYKYNTINGCTSVNSPNFNYEANVDDSSCENPGANLTFGGVYQTCDYQGDLSENLCHDLSIMNPKTGSNTCPEGYDAVPLFVGNVSKTEVTQECERYRIFWKKCHNIQNVGTATFQTYWCAAVKNNVPIDSGYLFGGIYTSVIANPMANAQGCPLSFKPLRVAEDINVCVSDDYQSGERYSVPFGGFFSCQQGNPLANTYFVAGSAPKTCPNGYSQHLATIDEGCEINYCVKMKSSVSSTHIKSPPFIRKLLERNDNSSYIVDNEGTQWTQIYSVPNDFPGFIEDVKGWITNDGGDLNVSRMLSQKNNKKGQNTQDSSANQNQDGNIGKLHHKKHVRRMSKFEMATIATISVISTLCCILVVVVLIMRMNTKRSQKIE